MQALDDTNDVFPNLLQKLADLMSQRAEDQGIEGRTFPQCDEELGALRTVQKQLERRVALVSQKRNTFVPINALPTELLVTIFAIALDYQPGAVSCDHETLLLVCHYWNHLVNDTPSLWTKIWKTTGMSNGRAIHSLEKSKDSPLDITCDTSSYMVHESDLDGFLGAIFPHAHRWRKASLDLGRHGQGLGPMATISTPLLESISLSTTNYFGWAPDEPLNIFGGRPPPRLRELFLNRISVPWSPTVLCNLNVLGISKMEHLAPSLDQLLAVLSACPCLESLAIQEVTFADGTSVTSLNTVNMPTLNRLELERMEADMINRLLAAIHAPNCKFGTLMCLIHGDPLEDLFNSDIAHFFDHFRSGVDAASITCDPGYIRLIWEGSWRIDVLVYSIRVAKGTLNLLHALPERTVPVVPFELTIRTMDSVIVEDILSVMANTEGLHRIAFGCDTPVAGALRLLATSSFVEGGTHGPFPELKEMWIEGLINDDDWKYFMGMLRRRQGEVDARDGVQALKPLRKVRFGGNGYVGDENEEISNFRLFHWPNRLEEVRRLLGPEGELVWYGRIVTEDGVLEGQSAPDDLDN